MLCNVIILKYDIMCDCERHAQVYYVSKLFIIKRLFFVMFMTFISCHEVKKIYISFVALPHMKYIEDLT